MEHASILASTALTKAPEDIDRFYEEHGFAMPRLTLPRFAAPRLALARIASALSGLRQPEFARPDVRA